MSQHEAPPIEHYVEIQPIEDKNYYKLKCSCGASWTVSKLELEEGNDHIADHIIYARRQLTRVD